MIEYRTQVGDFSAADLEGFFVDWPAPPGPEMHRRILENSYAVVLAMDDDEDTVVGFANAISDGILSAYIPLLEVRPRSQNRGIGSRLVEYLCDELDHLYMVDAVCDPELLAFYESLGFQRLAGMARRNYDNQSGTPPV